MKMTKRQRIYVLQTAIEVGKVVYTGQKMSVVFEAMSMALKLIR